MQQLEEFAEIRRKIQKNRGVIQVTGCIDPQKPHFISCSAQGYSHRVIITYSDLRAKELYEKYSALFALPRPTVTESDYAEFLERIGKA